MFSEYRRRCASFVTIHFYIVTIEHRLGLNWFKKTLNFVSVYVVNFIVCIIKSIVFFITFFHLTIIAIFFFMFQHTYLRFSFILNINISIISTG